MAMNLLSSTAEQRSQRVAECTKEKSKLKSEIDAIGKESAQLTSDNNDKINRRDVVTKQINSVKAKGGWIIFLGIVLGVVAAILLKNEGQQILRIGGIAAGVVVFILGIIVRSGWKKYESERISADAALREYDSKQEEYSQQIQSRKRKINEYDEELETIRDYEANMEYYQWDSITSTGHVFVFVTSDAHPFEDSPREPIEGKKYDSFTLSDIELYINDMEYDSGHKVRTSGQNGMCSHAELIDEGTQKLQVRILFNIGSNGFERISKPIPFRKNAASIYAWWHLSTCGKGTETYSMNYGTKEEFREAIGLTKNEMLQYFGR